MVTLFLIQFPESIKKALSLKEKLLCHSEGICSDVNPFCLVDSPCRPVSPFHQLPKKQQMPLWSQSFAAIIRKKIEVKVGETDAFSIDEISGRLLTTDQVIKTGSLMKREIRNPVSCVLLHLGCCKSSKV